MSFRFVALVFACALGLTIWFTWPLAALLSSHIPGRSVDAEQFIWSYWWFRQALWNQHVSPFSTTLLYFPEGTSLRFHTTNTLHAVLSIPFQALIGLIPTFNLLGMAIFVASLAGMAWLAYDISSSRVGALFAGIAWAFAPITLFHWRVGQYNMLSVEFVPLYILGLRRALLPNEPRPWRWVVLAAAALVGAGLCDWQFLIYLGLFSLVFVGAQLLTRRAAWQAIMLRGTSIALLALVVLLPFVLPMLGELSSDNPYMLRTELDTIYHSADVAEFLIPNPASPYWGQWATAQLAAITEPGIVATVVSLSYVMLAFALYGVVRRWKQAWLWMLIGAAFWLLALGPRLKWFGAATNMPLPYLALFQFEVIQISRFPARYFLVTLVCLAVLAALGMNALLANKQRFAQAVAGFGMLLLILELVPAPRFVEPLAAAPSFYTDTTLAHAGAIIEQPNPSNRGMYFQTLHGRPVVWGELSRDNPVGDVLSGIRRGSPGAGPEIFDRVANWNCVAAAEGFTHWVEYPTSTSVPAPPPGATLVRAEAAGSLYALESVPANQTCLWLDPTWQNPSALDDGTLYRWVGQEAQLGLRQQTPGRVELQMMLHCFAGPRTVRLSLDATTLAEQTNCGWPPQPLTTTLDLDAGWTWLTIASIEPASDPAAFGFPPGPPIAVAVSGLTVDDGR